MAQAQLMYVGTTQGVVILSNPGRTDRWLTVGRELIDQQVLALECESEAPMSALVWTGGGIFRTSDGGQQWVPAETAPERVTVAGQHSFPGQPPAQIRLAAAAPGLERSEDAGATWDLLPPAALEPEGKLTVICAPAYHPDTAYAGSGSGEIWATTDRGRTWSLIKRDLPPVLALAIGRIL